MPNICQITGKKAMTGNNVSHSNNRSKRRFLPNLQVKKFYLESQKTWVNLKVSAAGIRTIDKIGLENALKKAIEKGYYSA